MKLLHLGDLHIGKTVNDFSMIEDQAYQLDRVVDLVRERRIDAVLVAGDVYDRSVPGEEAVKLLDRFFNKISSAGAKLFLISGNHDSEERLNFGSSLFEASHIHISAKYNGTIMKRTVKDEFGAVNFYLLPFVKASQVKHFYPDAQIQTYEDAVRCALAHSEIDCSQRNILLAHQFVTGGCADPRTGGSESAAALCVGTVEKVAADCFCDFDYVALGHIHSPQKVGKETVRYAGSLLKYSLGEVNDSKSAQLVTLGEKGQIDIELLPLKPLREMRHLKGKLRQLLAHVSDPDDYIYATLTEEAPVSNVMHIFRQYYPNTMQIMYDNAYTEEMPETVQLQASEEKTFEQIFSDFYRAMYGCEISDEELALITELSL